jgi:SAM-dependent methyltransferase
MGVDPSSESGHFTGTAWYYARFRPSYPRALLDEVISRFRLDGSGRLLDLGCGTGELAVPLAKHFEEVVALDTDTEMVAEARHRAERERVTNVRWLVMPAESIGPGLRTYRLVTIGNAFHWMNRTLVLERCHELLSSGGGLALVGFAGGTFWGSAVPWEQAVVEVIRRWLGPERRAGSGTFRPEDQPRHGEILARSAFIDVQSGEISVPHIWDLDTLIGYLYSTSFCSPALLGPNRSAFEDDLRQTLLALNPVGRYEQTLVAYFILAAKG